MSKKPAGKPLRFAALIRVSTEKQERQGESLRTQEKFIKAAVESLGGKITKTYAGQEHATPGSERKLLDSLLEDAAKDRKPFDAVIVADATRWSRDNVSSTEGLDVLRENGILFYVLGTQHDLFNQEARLFLGLTAVIGAYHASTQKRKSTENRIERAKRGIPTGGHLPFGRLFDKITSKWSLDPEKVKIIKDVAERYLDGESLQELADEYKVNHSNLVKTLRVRCGSDWGISFKVESLDIDETIPIRIPRLLSPKIVRKVQERLKANRTNLHGKPKHPYLLGGRVFCAECGYCMFGQTNEPGTPRERHYYRHSHSSGGKLCELDPRPWVRCDELETAVVRDLFNFYGNPAAIDRAVNAAAPKAAKLHEQRERLEKEIAKIGKGRDRLLDLVADGDLTKDQSKKKLADIKKREDILLDTLDQISSQLVGLPSAEQIENAKLQVIELGEEIILKNVNLGDHVITKDLNLGKIITIEDDEGNTYAGGNDAQSFLMMDDADRKKLIDSAFSGPLLDGKPAGVYITRVGKVDVSNRYKPKKYTYEIHGTLTGQVTQRALR